MDIEVWDTAFVRARRRDLHPPLRDPAEYGQWWPGTSSAPRPWRAAPIPGRTTGRAAALLLRPPTLAARVTGRVQRLAVTVVKDRPGLGVDLAYRGTLDGTAEWYYLDEVAGVTVHYVVHARVADRGWRGVLADHRAVVRLALDTLKDGLEGVRIPGQEPDPALLADQRVAAAEFEAGVRAWARKTAAADGQDTVGAQGEPSSASGAAR